MKSLGSYYSEENVRIRLAKNRSKVKTPKHLSREARLYINISTYVTTGNREGFERWTKLNNLKEAARCSRDQFRLTSGNKETSVILQDFFFGQIISCFFFPFCSLLLLLLFHNSCFFFRCFLMFFSISVSSVIPF